MTFRDRVSAAAARLEAAGVDHDEAVRSAVTIARFALQWTGADWIVRSREEESGDFPGRFGQLVERRAKREPVAYITGIREFYGCPFLVTPDVLIPRPETELIIDLALAIPKPPAVVIDIGTGSGCLAVTLASELSSARIIATDISAAALAVARANAKRMGVAERIEFRHGALLATSAAPHRGLVLVKHGHPPGRPEPGFDLIVANPPYIDPADRSSLPPEVADYEPGVALFAEEHGLALIRAVIDCAAAALAPGGTLLVEIGQGQAEAVRAMVEAASGLTFIEVRPDLQGIPRVLVVRGAALP